MTSPHPVYRSLVLLYPRAFRRHYGDDMVRHFADLVADRGSRDAWVRTSVDLLVTVPRYRLETITSERRSTTVISVCIAGLTSAAVLSLLTGLYPGMLLALAALVLGIAQRSTLARALRTPDTHRRHRRLVLAAILAAVCVVSFVVYYLVIGDRWTVRETVLAVVGAIAMVGAPVFLALGLLTPKAPRATA